MSSIQAAPAATSWRTPMVVLVCGALILALLLGIRQSFGLFQLPMIESRGWGREVFSLAIALQNLVWGLSQPFFGAIADRFGSARVMVLGALLYGGGLVLMAIAASPMELYLSGGMMVGFGLSAVGMPIVIGAVGRMTTPEKRSLAFGIVTAGGSFGQFAIPAMSQDVLIANFEWMTSLFIFAGMAALIVPLAAAMVGKPAPAVAGIDQTMRQALAEAGGHSGYLFLTAGFFVCGFQVTFIGTHLPAYLLDQNLSASTGAWALAMVGLFNIVGSFTFGFLGGRYRKKWLLASLYAMRSVVVAIFLLAPLTPLSAYVFGAAMGLLWLGTVPLTSGLVAQLFGTRYLSTLFGITFASHQVGAFIGVWFGGYLFDATGSYDYAWLLIILLGLVATALHWPIDDRAPARMAAAGPGA